MEINPMRFDLGAYHFGKNEIQKKEDISTIYKKLIQTLLREPEA